MDAKSIAAIKNKPEKRNFSTPDLVHSSTIPHSINQQAKRRRIEPTNSSTATSRAQCEEIELSNGNNRRGDTDEIDGSKPQQIGTRRSSGKGGRRYGESMTHSYAKDPLNLSSISFKAEANTKSTESLQSATKKSRDPLNLLNKTPHANVGRRRNRRKRSRKSNVGQAEKATCDAECSDQTRHFTDEKPRQKDKKLQKEVTPILESLSSGKKSGGGLRRDEATPTPGPSTVGNQRSIEDRRIRHRMMAKRYRYGNFNFYYQKKRLLQQQSIGGDSSWLHLDPRVELFLPDWFSNKTVLDIGCNAGIFTISLASRFHPTRVVGMDIDPYLIQAARKNLRYFIDKESKLFSKFPASFSTNFGPISSLQSIPANNQLPQEYPYNIYFICANYVSPNDSECICEEYDIIFAIATVKWVHLNWGDEGVKRFFNRVFRQLRTNGRFILETESFGSYRKHCNQGGAKCPPDEVLATFRSITLLPEDFTTHLTEVVGFSHFEDLDTPLSKHLGISGRLQVFYKGKFMLGENDVSANEPAPMQQVLTDTDDDQTPHQICTPPTPLPISPAQEPLPNQNDLCTTEIEYDEFCE